MRILTERSHFRCQPSYDRDGRNNISNSMMNSSIIRGLEFIDFNYMGFFFFSLIKCFF